MFGNNAYQTPVFVRDLVMGDVSTKPAIPTAQQLDHMHALYRQGGKDRQMAPHVVYAEAGCPHAGCLQKLQAIDFRLEAYGPTIHDPLVRAWWDDTGFAGRCPKCGNWIHFTIRGMRALTGDEARQLPQLPDDWHHVALIL
jgi:hypothetical protein